MVTMKNRGVKKMPMTKRFVPVQVTGMIFGDDEPVDDYDPRDAYETLCENMIRSMGL
jgi:hypothetical protein